MNWLFFALAFVAFFLTHAIPVRPNIGIGGITPARKLKRPRSFYGYNPLKTG